MEKEYLRAGQVGAFGGVRNLSQALGVSRKKAQNYLYTTDIYTTYKPQRKTFPRRRIIAYSKFELLQMDLMQITNLARHNNGYNYILIAIDTLSKFLFMEPIKNKGFAEMQRAMTKILRQVTPKCKLLLTDRGTEFLSRKMQNLYKKFGVKRYHIHSEKKAAGAERAIKSIRNQIQRLIETTGSKRFVHLLPKLAYAHNHRVHSRTGLRPVDVDSSNETLVFERLYAVPPKGARTRANYKVGDLFHISLQKPLFTKSSTKSFTAETFAVSEILPTVPISYRAKTLSGKPLLGTLYEEEMSRAIKTSDSLYEIDKIKKTRVRADGKIERFVSFKGWPSQYDAWVLADDIHRKSKQ